MQTAKQSIWTAKRHKQIYGLDVLGASLLLSTQGSETVANDVKCSNTISTCTIYVELSFNCTQNDVCFFTLFADLQ